jgi:hypothetical protein
MSLSPPEFTGARYALAIAVMFLLVMYGIWVFSDPRPIKAQLIYGALVAFISVFGLVYGNQWIRYRGQIYPRTPIYAGILTSNKLIEGGEINEVKIQIGNSRVYIDDPRVIDNVLQAWGNDHFTVELYNGNILVSTKLRDDQGNVIAELNRNEWKVNPPPGTWDRNYTSDRLEIIDKKGNVVLQLHVLPGTIQIQGAWQITISGTQTYFIVADVGVGASVATCPILERCSIAIQPIFRYPSETHLGELL